MLLFHWLIKVSFVLFIPMQHVTNFQRIVMNVAMHLQKSSRNYQFRAQQRH